MPDKHTQNRLLAYSTPLILALILLAFVVGVTLTGDKALARTALDLLESPELLAEAKKEHASGVEG